MHSCRAVDSCPAQPMGTTLRRCLYITAKIGRISLSRVPTVNISTDDQKHSPTIVHRYFE